MTLQDQITGVFNSYGLSVLEREHPHQQKEYFLNNEEKKDIDAVALPIEYLQAFLLKEGLAVSLEDLTAYLLEQFNSKGYLKYNPASCKWCYTLVLEKGFLSFQAVNTYSSAYSKGFSADDLDGSKAIVKRSLQARKYQIDQAKKLSEFLEIGKALLDQLIDAAE